MKFDLSIDPSLFDTYPEIHLGCLRFQADVMPPDEKFWRYLDDQVLPEVRETIRGRAWSEIPGVRGSRLAYKAFGRSPSRFRVSSEALLRRVRRGDELYHINSVVDVNNLISVTSGLSVGSYDIAKIKSPVILRKAGPGEGYEGIGKEFLDMENMLCLADEDGIFGSTMSDSQRSMVTESAKDILVVIYCFEDGIDLKKLLGKSREAFEKFAAAKNMETWLL